MNFVSLKQFKSILEMNNKLKIRICAVGPIKQDGLARGRKWPARGPAKLSTRAGHHGHAAWPVAARNRWAGPAMALGRDALGRARRARRFSMAWPAVSRRSLKLVQDILVRSTICRASARQGLEDYLAPNVDGGVRERSSPTKTTFRRCSGQESF